MADIKDPDNTILIELEGGTVAVELLPDVAPKHVERMKEAGAAGRLRRGDLSPGNRGLHGPDRRRGAWALRR